MARDLFQDFGLNPQAEKEGRDLFKEYGIDPAGAAIGGNEDSARIAVPAVLGNKSRVNSNFADDVGTDFKRGILGLPGAVTGLVDAGYNLTPVPKLVNMAGDPLGLGGRPTDAVASKLGELTGIQPAKWAKESEAEYSPSRQQASRGINEAWDQARLSDPGTWADVAKAYMENPEATLGTIVESAPSMVAGGVLGKGLKAANLLRSGSAAAGAGEGAIMAGQAMDSIDRKVDPQTAAKASLAIGVGGGLLGAYGSKIANKIGIRDFETAIVGGVPLEKSLPLYARIPAGILQEGVFEEFPQSVQEQVFKNLAEGKPWHDGVARSAVEGALAGGLMGGAFNVPGSRTELSAGSAQIDPTGATQQATGTTEAPAVAVSGMASDAVDPEAAQQAVAPMSAAPIDQTALLAQLDKAPVDTQQSQDPYAIIAEMEIVAQQQGGLAPEQADRARAALAQIEQLEDGDNRLKTGSADAAMVAQSDQGASVGLPGGANDLGGIHDGNNMATSANSGLPIGQVQQFNPIASTSATGIEQSASEPIVQTQRTKEIDAKLAQIVADIPKRTAPVQASLRREAERLKQDRAEEVQKAQKMEAQKPNSDPGTVGLSKDSLLSDIKNAGVVDVQDVIESMGFTESSTIKEILDKAVPVVAANLNAKLAEVIGGGNIDVKELQQPVAAGTAENLGASVEAIDSGRGKENEVGQATGRDVETGQSDEAGSKGYGATGVAPQAKTKTKELAKSSAPKAAQEAQSELVKTGHAATETASNDREATFKPLIEALIRNKRNAKQLGFDIDGVIARAKASMAGEKQRPGTFRKLAEKAEKRGDQETAGILREIANMNDARKDVALFSRADTNQAERQGLQWKGITSNANGPVYVGDGFSLKAVYRINTETDFEENGLPLGHASLVEGTAYRFTIADSNNNYRGFMNAEVNDFGEIDTIHGIELTDKNTGFGTKIIETILANAYDGVRIIDIAPDAKRFWGKFGADYYGSIDDFIKNARIEWSAYQRQPVRQNRLSRESTRGVRGISEEGTDRAGREKTSGQQEASEAEYELSQNEFLSNFPEGSRYTRHHQLLGKIREEAKAIADELGGKAEERRVVWKPLGSFTGYEVTAKIQPTDDFGNAGALQISIYGNEQIEQGLTQHPAQFITISPDGEMTMNGPPPGSKTFEEFQKRGWADYARDGEGNIQQGYSRLEDSRYPGKKLPNRQVLDVMADIRARVGLWTEDKYVPIYWSRATGAMGGLQLGPEGSEYTAAYFSQGRGGAGVSVTELQSLSAQIARQLPHMPAVHVFDSPMADGVPTTLRDYIEQQDATYDVEGAMFNGELYMFAKNLASIERAEHVLATHEITHVGLRGAIGEELDTALRHIWVNNSKVRKAAHELKQRLGIRSNEVAVEEVLADMPTSELIQLKGWRKAVLAVRNWLNRIGAETLAKKMDDLLAGNLSEQEQADLFVADLVTSAREWVKSGKPGPWAVAVKERLSATANNLSLSEWEASIINSGNYARLSLANELLYGIPNLPQGNRAIDGAELRALRRAAAGLEKPEKGLFLFVTEDGKALVTGYQGKRIPPIFIGFARQNNLKLEAYRAIPGRTTAMPVQSREEGATYFEERDAQRKPIERTGLTRFSARPVEAKKRAVGFDDKNSFIVADFKNDEPLKAHPDYKEAKAGNVDAAARLVQALVKPASVEAAKKTFGPDVIYVSVHAEEASGKNQIPNMLALHYAAETGASIDNDITQKNRAYHTGANAMERVLARAEFAGKVEPGRRYVLVDDVTTMGSTLADLANHIRSQGGEVVGSVVLVNAARSGMIKADKKTVRELEARHGEEISKLFGIEPGALTWSESQYLLGFRTTDELRNRVAKAKQERVDRLRSKGVLSRREDSQSPVTGQQTSSEESSGIRLSRAGNQPFSQQSAPDETIEQKTRRIGQDAWNRFKHVQDWLIKNGVKLSEQANVYWAEARFHGRVATRIEDFREKLVKPLIKKIQKAGFSMDQVDEYLHAQHAEERNIQIAKINPEFNLTDKPGSGMTTAEANAILAKADPQLKALANEVRDITTKAKELLLSSGIISQETADAWDATYKNYVPLMGDDSETKQGTGQGKSVNGKQQRAKGHGTRNEYIIENILRNYERAVVLSEKNLMGQHLLTLGLEANDPSLITIGKPEKRGVIMPGKTTHQVLYHGSPVAEFENLNDARHFVDLQGRGNMTINTVRGDPMVQYVASPQLQENEVQVYVLGQAVRVQLNDPLLARAYKSLGIENLNALLKLSKEFNSYLSKAYTGFNPYFLFRNVQRDFTTGAINITGAFGIGTTLRAIKNYPMAFGRLLRYSFRGIETQDIAEYRANGGSTGAAYLSDIDRIGADIQQSYNEYVGAIELARQNKKWDAAKVAGWKTFKYVAGWIEHLNAAGENAMRLALFNAIREEGGSLAKAANAAKDATVNFNRRGEIGAQAGAAYLFFNPNVQGTALLMDTLFRSEHKYQAQALAGGMVLSAFLMAMMQFGGDDDGEWDAIPDSEKSRNMIIRLPNGKRVNISVPYGWGIFHAMGNALYDLTLGKSPEKVSKSMLSALFEHFSPIGNPMAGGEFSPASIANAVTPFKPAQIISQMGTNRNGFGSQIVPESSFDKNKPDHMKLNRATRGTGYEWLATAMSSATGGTKATAGKIDVSPETIKFMVNTLVGGTGTFVADVLKLAKMGTWDLAQAETPEAAAALMPEIREIPFLNVMVKERDVKDARSNFWEKSKEAQAAAEEFSRIRKEGDQEGRQKYREDKEKMTLVALGKSADQYAKVIRAKRDQVDRVKQDEGKSFGEKRMIIRALEREEEKLYNKYISSFGLKMRKARESSQ